MYSHTRVRGHNGRAAFILGMVLVVAGAAFFVTMAAGPDHVGQEHHPGTFAEIRVHRSPPDRPLDDRFEIYRQTQGKLLKARFVLENAVQRPEIAQLDLIQRQPDPVDWLEKSLVVSFPGTEFLRISLAGHRSAEAAPILNAVVESYMHEVVEKQEEKRRKRLVELEKIEAAVAREVERLRADSRRQRELMAALPAREMELLDLDLVRKEYTRLRLKRIELSAALSADSTPREAEPNEAAAEPDPQRRELENVKRQIDAFESEFRALADGRIAFANSEIALDEIERQIASKEKILEQLREQIEKLTIELKAPIGIEVFREARPVE